LKKIAEYNISNIDKQYVCKFCNYETEKRSEFTNHINRTISCYYITKFIDGKEIRLKNNREYLVNRTQNREVLVILCKECYSNNIIKQGNDGKCTDHGGKKFEYPLCIEEGCTENGTQKMDGYCRKHYQLIDKENKVNQCIKCKYVFSDIRALDKHIENDNCLEKIKEHEEYKDTEYYIDGRTRRKCLTCSHVFKDLHRLKQHENGSTSCNDRKLKSEKMSKYRFINDEGIINYKCDKCDKIFDDRHNCEKHINGSRDCNPQYETKIINGKTIIYKPKNKYYVNEKGNLIRLCKIGDCDLCPIDGHYCSNHGGIRKIYYCEYIDEIDGKCTKKYKGNIDGVRYCINHGGQPSLKKCEEEGCKKLIHSTKFCDKHKRTKRVRNKENDTITRKKYRKNNLEKTFMSSCKASDKKAKRNIEDKNYITQCYLKAKFEMSNYTCHWCKREIHCNIGNYDLDQLSLDRLDNTIGHNINNLVDRATI
jgi:hypothetical protein